MNQDITRIVEAWLHEPAPLSDRGVARVAHVVHQTPQRRSWSSRFETTRYRSMFSPVGIVAGGAAAALAALVILGDVLIQRPSTDPVPAAAVSVSPSPDATVTAAPIEGVVRDPDDPRIAGDGPWLEWEPIPAPASGGGYSEPASQGTETGWRAEDRGYRVEVAGYRMIKRGKPGFPVGYQPVEIQVTRPDGTVVRSRIDGPWQPQGVTIGPRGLVLQLVVGIDRWDIYRLATGRRRTALCCTLGRDGVVRTKPGFGLPQEIKPSEYRDRLRAVGLTPADLRAHRRDDTATTWFSRDGESWARIEGWPFKEPQQVLATEDGFYALGQQGIAYTADASRWALVPGSAGVRAGYEWGDDLLATLPGRLARVTPTGLVDLPFTEAVLGPGGAIASVGHELMFHEGGVVLVYPWTVVADDFGIVVTITEFHPSMRVILYSPDGDRWSLSTAPEPMLEPGRFQSIGALDGEIVMWSRGFDDQPAEYFGGTPRSSDEP